MLFKQYKKNFTFIEHNLVMFCSACNGRALLKFRFEAMHL